MTLDVTSCLHRTQENSMKKADHGGSDRDSELKTADLTPTDIIKDRRGSYSLIYHDIIYAILAILTTNQGPKVKESAAGT